MAKKPKTIERRKQRSKNKTFAAQAISLLANEPLNILQTEIPKFINLLQEVRSSGRVEQIANPLSSIVGDGQNSYSSRAAKVGTTAVIALTGFIEPKESYISRWGFGTSLQQAGQDVRRAKEDSDVEQIVLYVDSPGGYSRGNREFSDIVYDAGKAKQTIGFAEGLACSAGYYGFSACNRLIATPSSLIGSVGSMVDHFDYSQYLADVGIKATNFTFGENKGDGYEYEPLSDQAANNIQDYINSVGMEFVNSVARNQGISADEVLKNYGQGKAFLATQALELGMIDEIGTFNIQTAKITISESASDTAENRNENTGATNATQNNGSRPTRIKLENRKEPAVSSNNNQSSAGSNPQPKKEVTSKMNEQIKAALLAAGLIDSWNVSDEICQAALSSFCKGKGVDVPEKAADVLSLLTEKKSNDSQSTATNPAGNSGTPTPPAENGTEGTSADANDRAKLARTDSLTGAQATLTGLGFSLSAEEFNEAVNGTTPTGEIIADWTNRATENSQAETNRLPAAFRHGEAPQSKFRVQAVNQLLKLAGCVSHMDESGNVHIGTDGDAALTRDVSNWSARHIFEGCMQQMGMSHEIGGHFDLDFNNAMARGIEANQEIELSNAVSMTGSTTPADLSLVVGTVINIMFDTAMTLRPTTYQDVARKMADFESLDPVQMAALSSFKEMDQVTGSQPAKEFKLEQELLGSLQISQFHNFLPINFELSRGNKIEQVYRKISAFGQTISKTNQRLVLEVLHSSETFADSGQSFFHANHNNLISAGGAPSRAQATKHRIAMMKQKDVGTAGGTLNITPSVCYVPTGQLEAAEQTYLAASMFDEMISKQTDATINPNRGKVKVVPEPDLDGYSTTAWYTFANPALYSAIVYAFLKGFGPGGRRTVVYDTKTRSTEYHLQHCAGAGVENYRFAQKDPGA